MFKRKRKVERLTVTVRAVTRDGLFESIARISEAFDEGAAEGAARALMYAGVRLGACAMADEVASGPTDRGELERMRGEADEIVGMVLASRGVTL